VQRLGNPSIGSFSAMNFQAMAAANGKKRTVDPMALSTRFAAQLEEIRWTGGAGRPGKGLSCGVFDQPLRTRLGRVWLILRAGLRELSVKHVTALAVKAGTQPMEMSFTALDGSSVDLAKLRGKVVLIDFWATWCHGCVQVLPELKAIYAKYPRPRI